LDGFPRFPPLEVFVRRPPEFAAPSVSGRHPKTFTIADIKIRDVKVETTPVVTLYHDVRFGGVTRTRFAHFEFFRV
jgi:hypothetical protein